MTLPEGPPASQPQGRDATRRLASSALLIAVLGIGTILRLSEGISGGIWLDEYHTLLLAGAPTISEVLARTSVEAHPPAYLIALHLVMQLVGDDPLVAKGFSVLCGVATLLLVALAAHRRRGVLSAIVASTVLGGSAVSVHFATEIRPYAAVALTILVGLLATVSAVERPTLWRLLAQAGALIVALGLNFLALVLLPVGPLLGLLRTKPRLVAKQLMIGAVAVLVTSPPLVRVATELPPEANEYLQTFWQGRTAVDALVVVGRDLLSSGRWPPAYGSTARRTGFDQGLEAFAMAGVVLVLAGAGAAGFARGGSRRLDLLDAGARRFSPLLPRSRPRPFSWGDRSSPRDGSRPPSCPWWPCSSGRQPPGEVSDARGLCFWPPSPPRTRERRWSGRSRTESASTGTSWSAWSPRESSVARSWSSRSD